MVTNHEYGYEEMIKSKVGGKASTQITAEELKKANRYASDLVDVKTDKLDGWNITVNQTNGEITSTEPYANLISSIADKLAAQLLRYDFNEQKAKSESEWTQAMHELEEIKMSIAKLGSAVSSKTIVGSSTSTFPSDPLAQFISGVRKKVVFWN